MNSGPSAMTNVDPANVDFSESDFAKVAKVAKALYGLHLEKSKAAMIKSRLSKRLRQLDLTSYSAYCDMVERGIGGERDHFVSALTTNVTHFYRELHHFEYLEGEVLPALTSRAMKGERVRIWSAGCSAGQEPYSIAGSVLHVCPDIHSRDFRILATDIDPEILRRAEQGFYPSDECRFPSPTLEKRILAPAQGGQTVREVRPDIRRLVTFRRLNLNGDWPMSGLFDVVMCRNVAIYFDTPTQQRLWGRFHDILVPGGSLIIGHSERVTGMPASHLRNVGITTYQKPADWRSNGKAAEGN